MRCLLPPIVVVLLALCIGAAGASDKVEPVEGVPDAVVLKRNGGWCWFQTPRAIVTSEGTLLFNTISGDSYAGYDGGDLWLTAWEPGTETVTQVELHDKLQQDDHDVAALLQRDDGRLLAVYGKHGNDPLQRFRLSTKPGDPNAWDEPMQFVVGAGYTYSNLFQLAGENGRIYNFHRGIGYNPNCTISDDGGETWRSGWRLLNWRRGDFENDPRYTGTDGGRPYVVYASDDEAAIHFATTDDHPRAYDNSIYHGFYRDGKLHDSAGNVVGAAGDSHKPSDFTEIFHGDADPVVPMSESQRMVDRMNRDNGEHAKLTLYPGVQHDSWTQTYNDPAMWQWLFSQRLSNRNDDVGQQP